MIIGGKNYNFKFTGLTLHFYKEQFHKDFLFILANDEKIADDVMSLLQILWALIKTSDHNFMDYLEWLDSMSMIDIANLVSPENAKEIIQAISSDYATTKELKKK